MQTSKLRYILTETAISVAINVLLSEAFAWLIFHAVNPVPAPAILRDAIPQTVMVAFMGSLVPGLITRARLRTGQIPRFPSAIFFIRNPFFRALTLALVAVLVGVPSCAFLIPSLWPQGLIFSSLLWMKGMYGALVAALITPVAVSSALSEDVNS